MARSLGADGPFDPRQVGLLLALRLRIWTGELRRRPWRTVPAAVLLVGGVVLVAVVASWLAVTVAELRAAGRDDAVAAVVRGVHSLAFLAPLLAPVLALRVDDPLESAPLAALPVSTGTWLVASLLRSLGAPGTVAVTLAAVAVSLGAAHGIVAAVAGPLAAVVCVSTAVALGRLCVLRLAPLLRSRRPGDRLLLVGPAVGAVVLVGLRVLFESGSATSDLAQLFLPLDAVLGVVVVSPAWWSAQVVVGSGAAAWLPLLAFALLGWALGPALARAHEAAHDGDSSSGAWSSGGGSSGGLGRSPGSTWTARLSGALGALVTKDRLLLRREPAVRAQLMQVTTFALVPAVIVGWSVVGSAGAERAERLERLGALLPHVGLLGPVLVLVQLPLLLNQFGFEGDGLASTLRTPVDRTVVCRAKWVAHVSWLLPWNLVAVLGVAVLLDVVTPGTLGVSTLVGGVVEVAVALAAAVGLGLVLSVEMPARLTPRSRRGQATPARVRGGCGAAMLAGLLVVLTLVAVSPYSVVVHFVLPRDDTAQWVRWGSLVAAGVWVAAVVPASLSLAASRLRRREEPLADVLCGR